MRYRIRERRRNFRAETGVPLMAEIPNLDYRRGDAKRIRRFADYSERVHNDRGDRHIHGCDDQDYPAGFAGLKARSHLKSTIALRARSKHSAVMCTAPRNGRLISATAVRTEEIIKASIVT